MALYVQVDLTFFTSKKVIKGARILGITPIQFGGHMIALWAWSMTNAKDGVLDDLEPQDIATAAGYPEDVEKFLKTIIAVGFVDSGENLTLHNWQERSGKILELQEKDRIRAKEKYTKKTGESTENPKSLRGESTENPGITSGESEILGSLTEPNLTKLNLTSSEENTHMSICQQNDDQEIEPEIKIDRMKKVKIYPFPLERAAEIWNQNKSALQPGIEKINDKRKLLIAKKMKDFPSEDLWITAVKRIAKWEFANGKSDSLWVADFDYLLSEKGSKAFERELQGTAYDPKRPSKNFCQSTTDYTKKKIVFERRKDVSNDM